MIDITEILDVQEQKDNFTPFGPSTKNGSNFEKFVGDKLNEWLASNNFCDKEEYALLLQPKYVDHYGIDNKRKDFKIKMGSIEVMVEAKWLGRCQSDLMKLDYEWNNLAHGCYGNYYIFFYDYEKNHKNIMKMNKIRKYAQKLKYALIRKNIYFEFIEVNKYFNNQMDFSMMNFFDSIEDVEPIQEEFLKDCMTRGKIGDRIEEPKIILTQTQDGKVYVNQ